MGYTTEKQMGNSLKLIMIDDDSEDHQIFEIIMKEIKGTFEIVHFEDCEQAISHYAMPGADQPHMVFVDINLPRINGTECISRLQTMRRFDHPKIVIYSSSIQEHLIEDLRLAGVDDFLEKTGSLDVLKEKLTTLLSDTQHIKR